MHKGGIRRGYDIDKVLGSQCTFERGSNLFAALLTSHWEFPRGRTTRGSVTFLESHAQLVVQKHRGLDECDAHERSVMG